MSVGDDLGRFFGFSSCNPVSFTKIDEVFEHVTNMGRRGKKEGGDGGEK